MVHIDCGDSHLWYIHILEMLTDGTYGPWILEMLTDGIKESLCLRLSGDCIANGQVVPCPSQN